jgi:hypothetical protein
MGLDMYLYKVNKEAACDPNGIFDRENFTLLLEQLLIEDSPSTSKLIKEIGYWRKANSIHKFFVENVQNNQDDCDAYEVPQDILIDLLAFVDEVLSDNNKAEELLPTQEGFFFGSVEYDEYYIDDLSGTKSILITLLDNIDWEKETVVYQSSW